MTIYNRIDAFGKRAPVLPDRALPTVVLGAKVFPDGTPSDALLDRVTVAIDLFERRHASRLIFSGGSHDGTHFEADVMRRIAASVPDAQVQLERESRSTAENAERTAALISEREIVLVTCDFHLARATAHFRHLGFTVWPVPSPRRLSAADRLMVTGKEALALLRRPWLLTHV